MISLRIKILLFPEINRAAFHSSFVIEGLDFECLFHADWWIRITHPIGAIRRYMGLPRFSGKTVKTRNSTKEELSHWLSRS
jgi:hypothetical protein